MRMSCLRSSPILKKTLTFDPSASAFTKESFRGTALELKNEQDCRGEVHSSHPHPHPSHPLSSPITPSLPTRHTLTPHLATKFIFHKEAFHICN